jgi:hypothetical protein
VNTPAKRLVMPYPGLRPFEFEDQPLFFGREAQVAAMLRQLEDHRFVAVVGSSGSGKSSLVRAGLLPAIHEGFLQGSSSWLSLVIKPGHQPYERLGYRLHDATQTESDGIAAATDPKSRVHASGIVETLRKTDRGLLEALTAINVPLSFSVMVVVDQFEELFAFRRAHASRDEVASRDESASFVRMLLRSASDPSGRVWVVMTMRSDFIGNCEAFLGLPEAVSRSQFLVPRLDREQMEEAIRRPGEVTGAGFQPFTFADGLVNRMINEAGDRPDQLPLLQHALMRTWKLARERASSEAGVLELTQYDYEKAGGIEHALSLHADTAWCTIADDPEKANIARRLFLLLCDVSPDGQITRHRPRVREVEAVTGSSITQIKEVVRLFQADDRNFLLPPPEEDLLSENYLDVSHEALLRRWQLFANDWLVQERSDTDELHSLAKQANDHLESRGGLLGEQDLKRIGKWRTRVSLQWALRYVSQERWDALQAFIQESDSELERQRKEKAKQAQVRQWLWSSLGIILGLATLVSVGFAIKANRAENLAIRERSAAVVALVQSFIRPIGSNSYWNPSAAEQEALWELAELEPANQSVRMDVIQHWMKTEDSLSRALINDSLGLQAAIGLNKSLRVLFESQSGEAAKILIKALENPQEQDSFRLSDWSNSLVAMGAWMDTKDTTSVANQLADAQERQNLAKGHHHAQFSYTSKTLAALTERMDTKEAAIVANRGAAAVASSLEKLETDSAYLSELAETLAALIARINTKDAAIFADRGAAVMTSILRGTWEDNYRWGVGEALAALAPRMSANNAAATAISLANELEDLRELDSSERLSSLGKAFPAFAARMNAKEAASMAFYLTPALENLQSPNFKDRLSSIGKALAALAGRMNANDAAIVADRLTLALQKANLEKGDFPARLSGLGEALAALAARTNAKYAATLAYRGALVLVAGIEELKVDSNDISIMSEALVALAARMNPENAATLANRLIPMLESSHQGRKDHYYFSDLCKVLAALAARMNPDDAATLANRLIPMLESSQEGEQDQYNVPAISETLAALAGRMNSEGAVIFANRLTAMMQNPQRNSNYWLSASSRVLVAITKTMNSNDSPAAATRGAIILAKALENVRDKDYGEMSDLGHELAALAVKIPKAEQTRLAALSLLFSRNVPNPPKLNENEARERTTVARVAELMTAKELVEVLKWPFCVGEAQKIILVELERKTQRSFKGNVWKFIEQADSLGIQGLNSQFLDLPPKRPRIENAIKELQDLVPLADKKH